MEFIAINDSLAQISQQLSILQDYITLKFGLDFELYYKGRTEPKGDVFDNDNVHQTTSRRAAVATPKARSGRKSNSTRSFTSTNLTRRTSQEAQTKVSRQSSNFGVTPPRPPQELAIQHVKVEVVPEDDFFEELDGFSEPENFQDHEKAEIAPYYNSGIAGDFNGTEAEDGIEIFHGTSGVSTIHHDIPETETDIDMMSSNFVEAGTSSIAKRRKKTPTRPPSTHPHTGPTTILENSVGKPMISYRGFLYHYQVDGVGDKKLWRCAARRSGCKGRLHTTFDMAWVLGERNDHNHSPKVSFGDTNTDRGAASKSGRVPFILHGQYFKVVEQKGIRVTAECQSCQTPKSINGSLLSTTNFLTHLKRVHPTVLEEYHIHRKQEQEVRKLLAKKPKPNRLTPHANETMRLNLHLHGNGHPLQSEILLPNEFQPSQSLNP